MTPRTVAPASIVFAVLLATAAVAQGPLVGVSVPVGSQDGFCMPVAAGAYSIAAPPYPLETGFGIGTLVRAAAPVAGELFSLHDHMYVAPHVPDPTRAVIDYTFRWPVAVTSVEIVQHENGITRIEAFAGDSLATLTSVGATFGPAGDVTGQVIFGEYDVHVFDLPSAACGTHFRVIVRKTSLHDGWANYRIYPRDASGARIPNAYAPNALTLIATSTSSAAGIDVTLALNAGPSFAGFPYVIAGSISGACPGLPIAGYGTAAVNYDFLTAYTLGGPYVPETTGYVGLLDAFGSAAAHIVVAPGLYPVLVGTTFTHAGGAVSLTDILFGNPVTFTVAP